MRPKVTDFDRICRCRIGFQPRMPAKPNIAIFDLGIGRHILPFPTECTCLLKVPTHSVGTNTFLPGMLWADSADSTWPVQIGTRFAWNSLFRGAECHHSRGSILPQLHDPVHIFRRTPTIMTLSAFEPVENRTPAQVLVSQIERKSTRQILSISVTFGRMRGGPMQIPICATNRADSCREARP
jgi:hypothetical protein